MIDMKYLIGINCYENLLKYYNWFDTLSSKIRSDNEFISFKLIRKERIL